MYQVHIDGGDEVAAINERDSLLTGLIKAGVSAIPTGCRSGGCGICKVQILSGQFDVGQMSSAHVDAEGIAKGVVLACKVYPTSDIQVRILNTGVRRMGFEK